MIYLHIEILFGNKNEWTSDVLNIQESQKHYAGGKKPDLTVYYPSITVLSHLCEIPDK